MLSASELGERLRGLEQEKKCGSTFSLFVALKGDVFELVGSACWFWGQGKAMDWEKGVGKGTSVGSTEDGTSMTEKGSIVVLLQSWG